MRSKTDMNIEKWLCENTSSLDGKLVAISGATGGLGREICIYLGKLGASLVLVNRSRERALKLEGELRELYPEIQIKHITADLEDFDTVRSAADRLEKMPLDYLILNAGAYSIPRRICKTGYDNVFQINFIAPYYLARRLMPKIKERGGRVVAVGSIAHNYSKTDPADLDFRTRSRASLVYGNAKRYLMYSLLGNQEGAVSVAHPGITFTNITAHYPKLIFAIIKHPMKIIFMKPRTAALSIVRAIFESCSDFEWIGPSIFDVWGKPKKKKLRTASTEEIKRIKLTAEKIYSKLP